MNEGRRHQARGNKTEAKVTSELINLGIGVSAPVFGDERYDLIIDLGDDLERVQVKTAYDHHEKEETVVVGFESTVYHSDGKPVKTYYTADEIDSYVIYCPNRNGILYIPFGETPNTQMNFSFREESTYNDYNRRFVNFARDYLIENRLFEV